MIVEKYSKLSPNRKYFRVTSWNIPFFTFIFWTPEMRKICETIYNIKRMYWFAAERGTFSLPTEHNLTLSLPTGHNLTFSLTTGHNLTFSVLMIISSFFSAIYCVTTLCLKRLTFYASELGKISKMIETIRSTCDYDFRSRVHSCERYAELPSKNEIIITWY